MKTFIINKDLTYDDVLLLLAKNNIKFSIDDKKNIVLLENKNKSLIFPHKFYISYNLSIFIDRYCSYDVYKILDLLLKLFAIGILDYCNYGELYG